MYCCITKGVYHHLSTSVASFADRCFFHGDDDDDDDDDRVHRVGDNGKRREKNVHIKKY